MTVAAAPLLELDNEQFARAWLNMLAEEKAALPEPVYAQAVDRYRKLTKYVSAGIAKFERNQKAPNAAERKRGNGADGAALQSALILSEKGAIKACDHNAKELMVGAAQFDGLHFDEFLCRVLIGERDWTDHDDRDTLCWLQSTHRVPGFTLGQTRTAVMALAYARRRDALFEFVMGLPKWDGTPRINMAFTDAWGASDNALTRAAAQNFLVALIARAKRPGCQVDTLWVFEGPQGTYKSRAMRAVGGPFHAEISAPVGSADFYREMRGLWVAEMSELDSLRGKEASTIKRILSSPADRYVEKYEKHAVAYPRRAVAVATTNEAMYWQDSTGARRLVPVKVGEIHLQLIEENREQWFAEARHLFDAGATWWDFPSEIAEAQEDRQQVDPWEDILRSAMATGRHDGMGPTQWPTGWIASASIMRDWLRLDPQQQGQTSSTRLGKIMRRLGFVPQRFGKERERGWIADTSVGDSGKVSA
jgi:virulence-associated protein E